MARIFVYDGREYPDPGADLTLAQVQQQLGHYMPEITGARVKTTKRGVDTIHTFEKRVGVKGHHGG